MPINSEVIWQDFSKPLGSFIKRRVANAYDVEDILQEVFIKIHRNIGGLNDDNEIQAWVYTVARNAITDFYRKKKNEVYFATPDEINSENASDLGTDQEIAMSIKSMINHLPAKYKQAIQLTEFEDLTQKELAERLGLSVSGAKSRVQRARHKLKEMLLYCCHFEFDRWGNVLEYQQKSKDCKFCS